jgi:YidC/Oxa1 family membrane protein insertase
MQMPQDQDHQKNLLLAIVLSVAVLLAWQMFYAGPKLKDEQERRQRVQQEQGQSKQPGAAPTAAPGDQAQVALPSAAPASEAQSREAALRSSAPSRVAIDTPSLRGSIALQGGRIDDLVLVKYRETVSPESPNVVLFSPSGTPAPYYAEYGWVAGAGAVQPMPNSETVWRLEKGSVLTSSSPVTLAWDNGRGLVFRRHIAADDNYLLTVTDSVENRSGAEVTLNPYALISRHGLPQTQGFYILHEGPIGVMGEEGLKELHYADLLKDGGTKTFKNTGGWIGITDKYWAAALIPDQKIGYTATFRGIKGSKDRFQTDLLLSPVAIAAGATASTTSNLFAGAKQVTLIEAYGEKPGAKQFDLLIDWGWFYFITKPLFKLLHWLSQLLGNYGLAILATTVLVKLAFFPLANKSYESMAKMKKLQPEMEKIRERFKDDRVKQQQELMALYKNQKINPMSGCLPILLQIPVFFALYKVLFVTIDMRHAPFFGWIKDLSAPDPTSLFNLFGLLPYQVPDFLHIGVWPLIMGVTMWVQMQLNPQQPDPVQQKIFNWMPVIFTFMLASFPSGLVIYWAWNNVLSLLQQYTIMRKNDAEIHLWKNLGVEKWKGRLRSLKTFGTQKLARRTGADSLKQDGKAAAKSGHGAVAKGKARKAASAPQTPMTREQALRTLGLEADATAAEIERALAEAAPGNEQALNGSDHAIASKIDEARLILGGKAGA